MKGQGKLKELGARKLFWLGLSVVRLRVRGSSTLWIMTVISGIQAGPRILGSVPKHNSLSLAHAGNWTSRSQRQ